MTLDSSTNEETPIKKQPLTNNTELTEVDVKQQYLFTEEYYQNHTTTTVKSLGDEVLDCQVTLNEEEFSFNNKGRKINNNRKSGNNEQLTIRDFSISDETVKNLQNKSTNQTKEKRETDFLNYYNPIKNPPQTHTPGKGAPKPTNNQTLPEKTPTPNYSPTCEFNPQEYFHQKKKSNLSIFKFDKTLAKFSEKQIELRANFKQISPVKPPLDDLIDDGDELLTAKMKSIQSYITHRKSEEKISYDRLNIEVSDFNKTFITEQNINQEEVKEPVFKEKYLTHNPASKEKYSFENLLTYNASLVLNSNFDSKFDKKESEVLEQKRNLIIDQLNLNNEREDVKTTQSNCFISFTEPFKDTENTLDSVSVTAKDSKDSFGQLNNTFRQDKFIDLNELVLVEAVLFQANELIENIEVSLGDISCLLLKFSQINLKFSLFDKSTEKKLNEFFVLLFVFSGTCLALNSVNMLKGLNNNSEHFVEFLRSHEMVLVIKTLKNTCYLLHQNILNYIFLMRSTLGTDNVKNKDSNHLYSRNTCELGEHSKKFSTSLLRSSFPRNFRDINLKIDMLFEEASMLLDLDSAKKQLSTNNKSIHCALKNVIKKIRSSKIILELNDPSLLNLLNLLKVFNINAENHGIIITRDKILEAYEVILNETIEEMKKSTHYITYQESQQQNEFNKYKRGSKSKDSENSLFRTQSSERPTAKGNNQLPGMISNSQPDSKEEFFVISKPNLQLDYLNTIKEESMELASTKQLDSSLHTPSKTVEDFEGVCENMLEELSSTSKNTFIDKEASQESKVYLGKNSSNEMNNVNTPCPSKQVKLQCNEVEEIPTPYLPPMINQNRNTLVLDLDETLVHYVEEKDNAFIQVRPGAEDFLEEMSQYYELVVFTAAMQDYADLVLDQLDPNGFISFRLYRQHTIQVNGAFIKDLSLLGRDMSKIIIIDNVADNFQLQPKNGIHIKNFEGSEEDDELQLLGYELKRIAINNLNLIKEISHIKRILNENAEFFEELKTKS